MEKRWSIPLIGKIFIIRDTIEQSVFYIALALIMLCAILFLAVPSVHGMKMNKTASDLEDMTITLAGAGTEYSDETAGAGDNSFAATVHLDLAAGCFEDLNQAVLTATVFRQEQSLSAVPVKTASVVGYLRRTEDCLFPKNCLCGWIYSDEYCGRQQDHVLYRLSDTASDR